MTQKLTQTLNLRQQQSLVMTPQMQQAVKLLQMSNLELQDFLEEEMVQNPLLEKDETTEQDVPDGEKLESAPTDDTPNDNPRDQNPNEDAREDFDAGSNMADMGAGGSSHFSDELPSFEDTLVRPKTLREHLLEQLQIDAETALERSLGTLLIDRLDEGGYLREPVESLALQFGCSIESLQNILLHLKRFDPTGVFAADLPECLSLQLDEMGALDEPMQILLKNLPLLAQHDVKKLAKLCGVQDIDIADMAELIRTLNPRPSSRFDHVVAQTAIPDVLMKTLPKAVGGGWRVELNADTLPRMLVNQQYFTDVSARTKEKEEREYLTSQLANATWLVRALDQRAQTILKVASEIVERQDGFFLYGIEFLKPLTLRDIAEAI
ncbi:MAG: RNA polymerase sigma-54 factor, partial [Pseudomonadota bacterium]